MGKGLESGRGVWRTRWERVWRVGEECGGLDGKGYGEWDKQQKIG